MKITDLHQTMIKPTRSNDDDGRKVPLKYFCLKCRIWWEVNNLTLLSERFIQFLFASMSCKMCNLFFTTFSWPRWPIDLKLLQVCWIMYMVDYIKCLHCQQLFCLQNQFCNTPLTKKLMGVLLKNFSFMTRIWTGSIITLPFTPGCREAIIVTQLAHVLWPGFEPPSYWLRHQTMCLVY